jgi:hypothetical protein
MKEMITVTIEMDQHGTKNWQWFAKRVPKTLHRDFCGVRAYFSEFGYEVRGIRFL